MRQRQCATHLVHAVWQDYFNDIKVVVIDEVDALLVAGFETQVTVAPTLPPSLPRLTRAARALCGSDHHDTYSITANRTASTGVRNYPTVHTQAGQVRERVVQWLA